MLNLKDVMRHLPALQKALVGSKSELLSIICNVRDGTLAAFLKLTQPSQMLSDERLENVERLVSESLNEDASLQKVRLL
jgi:DNA mismatch repair protein MSH4